MDLIKFHHHVDKPYIYVKATKNQLKMNIKKHPVTNRLIQENLSLSLIGVLVSQQADFVALLFSKIPTPVGVHQEEFGGDE